MLNLQPEVVFNPDHGHGHIIKKIHTLSTLIKVSLKTV